MLRPLPPARIAYAAAAAACLPPTATATWPCRPTGQLSSVSVVSSAQRHSS